MNESYDPSLPRGIKLQEDVPAAERYDPTAPSAVGPAGEKDYEENKEKNKVEGADGTREEEGGKENAGLPSGKDKGALEKGGEAGGTRTSPGPTKEEVMAYEQRRVQLNGHSNGPVGQVGQIGQNGRNGLQVPQRPGIERFWSVKERMQPHLQLMHVSHFLQSMALILGVAPCWRIIQSKTTRTRVQPWW